MYKSSKNELNLPTKYAKIFFKKGNILNGVHNITYSESI